MSSNELGINGSQSKLQWVLFSIETSSSTSSYQVLKNCLFRIWSQGKKRDDRFGGRR